MSVRGRPVLLPLAMTKGSTEWMADAACAGEGSLKFYPDTVENEDKSPPTRAQAEQNARVVREAQRICFGCKVKRECLDYAIRNEEQHGVWGGKTPVQRQNIKRGARR